MILSIIARGGHDRRISRVRGRRARFPDSFVVTREWRGAGGYSDTQHGAVTRHLAFVLLGLLRSSPHSPEPCSYASVSSTVRRLHARHHAKRDPRRARVGRTRYLRWTPVGVTRKGAAVRDRSLTSDPAPGIARSRGAHRRRRRRPRGSDPRSLRAAAAQP
jgi:hypothetical protein